ncbi:MAG TPA: nickel-dependent lactate racemase [Bryobacteraceae bacterium]
MKIDFPFPGYENIAPVEVPDANLMGVFAPPVDGHLDESAVLSRGFAEPVGAPRLRDALRSAKRLLMLIDDGTRGTPVPRILPYVAAELEAAGIPDRSVAVLTAQGTHRRMNEAELKHKLGDYYARYTIHQHNWLDESKLREYGHTSDGVRVTANRLLAEHDFVLGIGSIVPHRVKGFSGGAKIAFPGVSGREMMEKNQWEASLRMSETVMGHPENPMRRRMEEAARLAGLQYIVNVVGDIKGRIVACFTGEVVAAHREGCKVSCRTHAVHLPERADIVLTDAHPADRDFWQSAKGLYSGTMAVRRGGSLINVAPNPEGVAGNHPNLLEIGYRPHAEVVRMVDKGEIHDVVGAAILGDVAQIVDHADCISVSPGMSRRDTERLGMRYAETAQQALEMAFERQGKAARVAVLRYGGHVLPLAG